MTFLIERIQYEIEILIEPLEILLIYYSWHNCFLFPPLTLQ
jgi:hypothetical protein